MNTIVEPVDLLHEVLRVHDAGHKRSRQVRVGPSQVGGCRAQVWLKTRQIPPVQATKRASAWMGTSIHDRIAQGIQELDPFGKRFLVEHWMQVDRGTQVPLSGTVDCFDMDTGTVIDWKTSKKSSLGWLSKGATLGAAADRWPEAQQQWQVHLYGWMLAQKGHDVQRVSLVGIARDGDEDHFRQWVEPFDPGQAELALAWLDDVLGMEEQPEPGMHPGFCRSYCAWYTEDGSICAGRV